MLHFIKLLFWREHSLLPTVRVSLLSRVFSVLLISFTPEVGLQTELRLMLFVYELFIMSLLLLLLILLISFFCFWQSFICCFLLSLLVFITILTFISNSITALCDKSTCSVKRKTPAYTVITKVELKSSPSPRSSSSSSSSSELSSSSLWALPAGWLRVERSFW